jgi:mRNA interferase MazF
MTEYERGDVIEATTPSLKSQLRGHSSSSIPSRIRSTENNTLSLTLTTRTWYEETLPVSPDDFGAGGVPAESSIVPWGVSSPAHDDIRDWFGRLEDDVVNEAVEQFVGYLME